MGDHTLPFEIGQKAEAMSFQHGFRGAWFRCEIKEIRHNKNNLAALLSYFDYPDEKTQWTKLYQVSPIYGKSRVKRRQLMLRPEYPHIYHDSQSLDDDAATEVIVVFDGVWKVGDLVDWWTDGCYWSGRLTKILDKDKAQIVLTPPPRGEGSSYDVFLKDLRPSLEWSIELGWTVPISKDGNVSRRCAVLIQPVKQAFGNLPILPIQALVQGTNHLQGTTVTPSDLLGALGEKESSELGSEKLTQPLSTLHLKVTKAPQTTTQFFVRNTSGETSLSDINSASCTGDTLAETTVQYAEDFCNSRCQLKKFRSSGEIPLNSSHSDSFEAAIMDLEELANKVKWLKRILERGSPTSNAAWPLWKFVEHRGSSIRR